jgi:deoxycytidylate deaminase
MIINAGIIAVVIKANYRDKLAEDLLKEAGVKVSKL